jgi:hypothetical protein
MDAPEPELSSGPVRPSLYSDVGGGRVDAILTPSAGAIQIAGYPPAVFAEAA